MESFSHLITTESGSNGNNIVRYKLHFYLMAINKKIIAFGIFIDREFYLVQSKNYIGNGLSSFHIPWNTLGLSKTFSA